MTQPNPNPESEKHAELESLPRDEGGPVFAEPWQAQAFAIAVRLSAEGYFTWKEWANALAAELAAGSGKPGHFQRTHQHTCVIRTPRSLGRCLSPYAPR